MISFSKGFIKMPMLFYIDLDKDQDYRLFEATWPVFLDIIVQHTYIVNYKVMFLTLNDTN